MILSMACSFIYLTSLISNLISFMFDDFGCFGLSLIASGFFPVLINAIPLYWWPSLNSLMMERIHFIDPYDCYYLLIVATI